MCCDPRVDVLNLALQDVHQLDDPRQHIRVRGVLALAFTDLQALRWMTAVTPYSSMRAITSSLAGTDLVHRHHFEEAAERYREQFTSLMDEWDMKSTQGVTSFESRYGGNEQWQSIPKWRYAAPDVSFSMRSSAADWCIQVGWLIIAFCALRLSARRLNP